jgi:hypothetical protein
VKTEILRPEVRTWYLSLLTGARRLFLDMVYNEERNQINDKKNGKLSVDNIFKICFLFVEGEGTPQGFQILVFGCCSESGGFGLLHHFLSFIIPYNMFLYLHPHRPNRSVP